MGPRSQLRCGEDSTRRQPRQGSTVHLAQVREARYGSGRTGKGEPPEQNGSPDCHSMGQYYLGVCRFEKDRVRDTTTIWSLHIKSCFFLTYNACMQYAVCRVSVGLWGHSTLTWGPTSQLETSNNRDPCLSLKWIIFDDTTLVSFSRSAGLLTVGLGWFHSMWNSCLQLVGIRKVRSH